MEGAIWGVGASPDDSHPTLQLSEQIRQHLPSVAFRWVAGPTAGPDGVSASARMPLYLNQSRLELVSILELPSSKQVEQRVWVQRSTALLAWEQA